MSSLRQLPLLMTANSIDARCLYVEAVKLGQRLQNQNAHADLRKLGSLNLKVFIGEGTSHPTEIFIQSYLSIMHWAEALSPTRLHPYDRTPGIVNRQMIDQIIAWIRTSTHNILYFIKAYSREKKASVTWEDKRNAGGHTRPLTFREERGVLIAGNDIPAITKVPVEYEELLAHYDTVKSLSVPSKVTEDEVEYNISNPDTINDINENPDEEWEDLVIDVEEQLDVEDLTLIEKHPNHPSRPRVSFH